MLEAMGITLDWDNLVIAFVVILLAGLGVGKLFRILTSMFHGFTR